MTTQVLIAIAGAMPVYLLNHFAMQDDAFTVVMTAIAALAVIPAAAIGYILMRRFLTSRDR